MSIVLRLAAESVWKRGRHTSENLLAGFRVQVSQICEQLSSEEYALTLHQEVLKVGTPSLGARVEQERKDMGLWVK
jgi:hypothetical protein